MQARLHPNEHARLQALHSFDVLDTEPEVLFDELVALASELLDVPIALISLVDEHRQWFKARIGFAAQETSLKQSFCAHAILDKEMLVVEDTYADSRFADNPLVTQRSPSEAPIRFYAGATLRTEDGLPLGTLCVLDHHPRQFGERERRRLGLLRDQAMALLDRGRLQAESEQRTRLKSEFLAHISHEIRTPLAAILGYAELLDGVLEKSDDLEIVRTILRNGGHLHSIVDELLDISRIEAGQLEIHHAPCALARLFSDIDSVMRIKASETGVIWRIECRDALPLEIRIDALRLRQILINLAGNALKFTAKGEVVLAVTSRETSDTMVEIEFAVRDTGIGMSAEQLTRVFTPFGQAESDTASRFGGSGLGLTISRELARLLDGELLVESEPGAGSVFSLRLTCESLGNERAVPDVTTASMSRGTVAPAVLIDALTGKLILVADDRDDIRYLAERALERGGARVVAVSGGVRALELLRQGSDSDARPFDALVLDMQMPELDGFGVLTAMQESGIDVPVIALTADALAGKRACCIAAGCRAFVSKPFTASDLVDAALALFAPAPLPSATKERADTGARGRLPNSADGAARVLIVDDSRDLTDALQRLLSRHGYGVESANTARAALALVAQSTTACIVLDNQMPDMNALELMAILRANENLLGTKFVSLSGSAMNAAERDALGFDLYLQKPVSGKTLIGALDSLLERTATSRSYPRDL